jgi:hypothetical protein
VSFLRPFKVNIDVGQHHGLHVKRINRKQSDCVLDPKARAINKRSTLLLDDLLSLHIPRQVNKLIVG